MLYSCARASDMSRVVKLVIDRVDSGGAALDEKDVAGFIEACALHTKGARSSAHKRTLLPLVAPMVSVSGRRWWDSFLQAREAMCMTHKGGLAYPLLGRFDEQGAPVADALQASEIGCYLRDVLRVAHANFNEVRSHSLKVTPLSWLAKAGSSLTLRRSLDTIWTRDLAVPRSMHVMQWRHRCVNCAGWCASLLTGNFSQTIHAVEGSKVNYNLRQLNRQRRTQKLSHMVRMRCLSVNAWAVTLTTPTQMHHQMLVETLTRTCWTPQPFGTWLNRSTGPTL